MSLVMTRHYPAESWRVSAVYQHPLVVRLRMGRYGAFTGSSEPPLDSQSSIFRQPAVQLKITLVYRTTKPR